MNPKLEIIDALIDGEPVDAGALRDALAESSGRDYLVDAWLLREAVQEDHAPAPALTCLRQARPDRRWLVAAALAGVGSESGTCNPRLPARAASRAGSQSR